MLPVASRAPFKPLAAPAAALSVSPTPKPSPPALAPASFAMASPLMGGLYAGADEAAAAFSAVDDILAGFGELPAAAAAAPAVAPVAEPVRQQPAAPPPHKPLFTLPAPKAPSVPAKGGFVRPPTMTVAPKAAAPSKPSASGKAKAPKAAKAAKAAKEPKAPKAPKAAKAEKAEAAPRAASAYMLFCASRRASLKSEQPELSFGELGKALGAEWQSMDTVARIPYVQASAAAAAALPSKPAAPRKRKGAEGAEGGASAPKKARAAASGEPKAPKAKTTTAWAAFCAAARPEMKRQQPALSFGELSKAVGEAWKALGAAERAPWEAAAAEATAAAAAAFEEAGGAEGAAAAASAKPARKRAPKAPKAATAAAELGEEEEEEEAAEEAAAAAEAEAEAEAMETDGEAEEVTKPRPRPRSGKRHNPFAAAATAVPAPAAEEDDVWGWGEERGVPVDFLVARHDGGSLIAVRAPAGVPTLEERLALRPAGEPAAGCQSEAQEAELEAAIAAFRAALLQRRSARDGGVDLDDLPPDSPLAAMLLLESLRKPGGPLHPGGVGKSRGPLGAKDSLIRIPAYALSFVVQRLVECAERRGALGAAASKAPPAPTLHALGAPEE